MFLLRPFDFGGTGTKFCSVLPSDDILVHGEIRGREYYEGRIEGLAMDVRVCVILRDLLDVLYVATTVCKWGQQLM
jgi:hypothetical protein